MKIYFFRIVSDVENLTTGSFRSRTNECFNTYDLDEVLSKAFEEVGNKIDMYQSTIRSGAV
jgi:hypothetical protein